MLKILSIEPKNFQQEIMETLSEAAWFYRMADREIKRIQRRRELRAERLENE